MNSKTETGLNPTKNPKQFYLVTVDLLQGIILFPMIIGHGILWWNPSSILVFSNWKNNSFLITATIVTGLMVFPTFVFLYGFNQVNSLLRKGDHPDRYAIRSQAVKRSLIFFLIALLSQIFMAIVSSPDKLLNYILTWQLFNTFGLSTLFMLFFYELACWINKRSSGRIQRRLALLGSLGTSLLLILLIFLVSYDYSMSKQVEIPVTLDLTVILQHALLNYGTTPLIPWLAFPLAGGMTAAFLNLPSTENDNIRKKIIAVLVISCVFLVVGFQYLLYKILFITGALRYPASPSLVFIAIGLLLSFTPVLILGLDLNNNDQQRFKKLLYPIISVSNISLTVYVFHNLVFALPPSIISSEITFFALAGLYSLFFVFIALIWQKKDYKWSLEWLIRRYS